MKKIYLLVAIFLSLFPIDSFASIENGFNLKKGFSASQINTNSVLINKTVSVLLDPISNPTASSTSICEGDTLTLTANPSEPLVTPYTFKWTGPNGYISTDENPVINNVTTANTGIYTLTIYDITNTPIDTKNTPFVTINAKIDPEFDATLPAICKGGIAPLLSTTSTNGIRGSWNPSVVSNTSTATYLFTPDSGQCANTLFFTIFVINNVIPKFTLPTSICLNDTPPVLPDISNNGIVGTWSPGTVSNTATGDYTFNPTPNIGQCALPITVQIIINPLFAIFTPAIPPICSGDFLTPLPTTSTNGITGNWSPATNNTATTTYTFTPDGGQCATATTDVTILVNPNIIPTFSFVTSICENDTAPLLPTISDNGITGTWNTPTVSNTTTGTYTFTSASGQCTNPAPPITITVNPNIVPTFDLIPDVCYGSSIIPTLPTTSNNNITGTWNPAIVSNTASTTYTFTPTAGICATIATLNINVNTIIPDFDPILPICKNANAPTLSLTSNNLITGKWMPPTIDTSLSGIYTYTFTPDAEQCATTINMLITINPTDATFLPVNDICSGDALAPLPTTSINGVIGSWSPPMDNTTTTKYTFTPIAGQCATTPVEMTIVVNQKTIPSFTAITPICSGSTQPVLPTTSTNSISGNWNPAIVSNTTSGTYTFTPTAGQCALTTTLNAIVYPSPTDLALKTTDVFNEKPDGIIEIVSVTSGSSPYQYSINNSSFTTNTIYSDLTPGSYTVTVRDSNGCEFSKVTPISSICIFPNAITPNNDSYNDTFNLKGCDVDSLKLFNRYGKEVKSYTNYSDQWDGTNSKGESLPDGTYFYVAEISDGTSKSGWVFIAR